MTGSASPGRPTGLDHGTAAPGLQLDVDVPGRLRARLRAGPGEVVAVVGPNGAGKSTLLQCVAGLVAHDGSVAVDGRDWTDLPVPSRSLGMLFQDRLLFPHLSALDNVAFGLRSRGTGRREARDLARTRLRQVGIEDLAPRRPATLSGGQAQRVALARALAVDPAVLLLDEPMGALDVGAASALRLELARHLRAYAGVTLLVTHDVVDALTLATTVVVLESGRVQQVGSPAEVSSRPRTDHVARLAGLNVLRGDAEGTRVRLADRTSGADAVVVVAQPHRGPVHVAFPAAAVALATSEPSGSARNRWRGRVRGLTAHEARVRVLVDLLPPAAAGTTLIADVTPGAVAELALAPGTEVWTSVKATETVVYPAVSDLPVDDPLR